MHGASVPLRVRKQSLSGHGTRVIARRRGILEVDVEICTACLTCERACPIDCIVIDAASDASSYTTGSILTVHGGIP